jgi:hypothetical protein
MLGLTLAGWEDFMVGSLMFAAIAAAVVGVSTWAVIRLHRQELAASKNELDSYKLERIPVTFEHSLHAGRSSCILVG